MVLILIDVVNVVLVDVVICIVAIDVVIDNVDMLLWMSLLLFAFGDIAIVFTDFVVIFGIDVVVVVGFHCDSSFPLGFINIQAVCHIQLSPSIICRAHVDPAWPSFMKHNKCILEITT